MLPVKKPWPNPMYFYALPTYNQARRVAWRPLLDLIPPHWIKKVNQSEQMITTVFGSELHVVGMDKPQRIEGSQWDGGVIDEACDQKPGAFDRSVLPALSHKNGWCWRIGVPKRVGSGAGEFRKAFETADGVESVSFTWPSEDILSEKQLRWARENLDPKDYNEQYRARWEDVSGLIFYAFDEVQNVDANISYRPDLPILVGSDFNVDPMSWALAQRPEKRKLDVFDEVFIRNTNTREALDYLHKKYEHHKGGWEFYGDATSKSRNTRASQSDYAQIKNDRRFYGAKVFYPDSNPARANRFAACNAMFLNADNERACKIHPRCKQLIADLTTRAYAPGTTEPDDHGDIGHMTDGFGYLVYRLFPIRVAISATPGVYISDG
jgi:hypothetical protein